MNEAERSIAQRSEAGASREIPSDSNVAADVADVVADVAGVAEDAGVAGVVAESKMARETPPDVVLTAEEMALEEVCCSVLQFCAVCCGVVQCDALWCSVVQCVAVCCSVVQCVAVCCSLLQCVAVCCSVLQCVVQGGGNDL